MVSPTALQHVISLEEVAWGIALIAVTMTMHAVAMPTTLAVCNRLRQWHGGIGGFRSGVRILLVASMMIVTAHLLEVVAWGAFFYFVDAFPSLSPAYYFSLMQFTTVGSDLALPDRWRLLGGMIAMAGLLTFAWSTTVLLTLAQQFQDEELQRLRDRRRSSK